MSDIWVAPTLDAAVARLAADRDARPIAAGVGVLLARALGWPVGERWVSVGGLPELRGWRLDEQRGTLAIGAATTIEALAEGGQSGVPALLVAAARSVANPGIRAVATVGGNVVAGRARSDLAVALAALGGEAEIHGRAGSRFVGVEDVADGGAPDAGELIRAFHVPAPPMHGWGWERLTVRGAMDRPSVSVGVAIGDGRARVVVGWAARSLVRLPGVEAALAAGDAGSDAHAVRATAARDLEAVAVIDDDRASSAYRRRVIPVLVERAARSAATRR